MLTEGSDRNGLNVQILRSLQGSSSRAKRAEDQLTERDDVSSGLQQREALARETGFTDQRES
jgi:hypothetical protein